MMSSEERTTDNAEDIAESLACLLSGSGRNVHSWHMAHAVRLSGRALGNTAENPPVGCVIVKAGKVVGVGHTAQGGRPHAETQALAMAGEAARGADVYVTLEPCAHHGRTPPCAEALAEAGVARVFIAVEDPDGRVAGRGIEILKNAGIEVHTGLLAGSAEDVLAGYLMRKCRGRPRVLLKLAVSADGRIAARSGEATPITGERARARAHLMRAKSDAILVGVDTVIIDDPQLTCRLPGLEERSPLRIVLDSHLRIPPKARLLAPDAPAPTWIVTTPAARQRAQAMQSRLPHVRILPVPAASDGRVDISALLSRLGEEGINNLMVEGGARVARAFVEADRVDRVALFTAPEKTLGPQGVEALAGLPLSRLVERPYVLREEIALGPDVLRVYEKSGAPAETGGDPGDVDAGRA